MRITTILIMIAYSAGTLTAAADDGRRYSSGEEFSSKVESLRLAVEDLIQTFGQQYPNGRVYLEKLESVDEEGFAGLQRQALVANPLVSGQPLLYVARAADRDGTHHYLERWMPLEQQDAFEKPGAALKVLDPATGTTETIVETAEGIIRNPCVHFDGNRILFSMSRNQNEYFNIYEIDSASPKKKVRQITNASDVSDVDPVYLPDDSILFTSCRDLKYVPCDTQMVPHLFRMDLDGANIHQITRSTAHENQISLMPDGRILYSRWDYVDRNFSDGHCFWVTNPDGTNPALIWGNNTTNPSAAWNARTIPATGRLLCILGTHHSRLGGALAIIAPRIAIDGPESIIRTWPAEVKDRFIQPQKDSLENERSRTVRMCVRSWSPQVRQLWEDDANMRMHRHDDSLRNVKPWYNTPWPLSEKYFLCVRAPERMGKTAIYLVDVFGNEIKLHADESGCYCPMPLAPSPRPAVIQPRRDYGNGEGIFYIQNVYIGTHMKGVKPGLVKKIRVVEVLSKRGLSDAGSWEGMGGQDPGVNWTDFNPKQVLGTVPVEADGSAYFAVPCDRFIYFQLLDKNDMMIQSMRSGTSIHSGEKLSCIGCHESRLIASPYSAGQNATLALKREPSRLSRWYGPPRPFSYQNEVQPVLDKYCIRCHDFGKKGAKRIVLAGDRNASFCVSYMELWSRKLVGGIGAGPAAHLPPRSWGSSASHLIKILRARHKNVRLNAESMNRMITWADINGPYYPTACCAYPYNTPGRCPLNEQEMQHLARLTGFYPQEVVQAVFYKGPVISFDRPELSPCLVPLSKDSNEYREALAIIRKGQERMKERPRADMPGFVPWEKDRQRLAHVEKYRRVEANSRKAIRKEAARGQR
ncbi:MAG TPA: hypothetical protein HPP87_00960 [Planctomycetes bacterium]|nr:hypothetical protein [Planctomycetota bacterium]